MTCVPQCEAVQELALVLAGWEGSAGKAILTETIQLGQCKLREGSGECIEQSVCNPVPYSPLTIGLPSPSGEGDAPAAAASVAA